MNDQKFIMCEYHSGKNFQMYSKHYHAWLELYYLEFGSGSCLIEDTLYSLETGDIMIIPPGLIHQSSYTSKIRTRLLINMSDYFYPDFIYSIVADGYVFRNPNISAEAFEIMKSVEKEHSEPDEFSDTLLVANLYRLFALLARNENYYTDEKSLSLHVKKALEYINKHYNTDITASQVAEALSVSRAHLSRIFKKETGIEITKYITNVKISHAEQLLKENNNKSITEIAYDCGFNDSNYFSVVFKKMVGTSPLKFRKQYSAKKQLITQKSQQI